MKENNKLLSGIALVLLLALFGVIGWGIATWDRSDRGSFSDGIEQIDLDTIYLQGSGVEVSFSDVLLSKQEETRQLIVSTQKGTVSMELTDRLIKKLDFDFMKKTQKISYTGTGYFVVDLSDLTADDIVEDKDAKTVTIRIDHAKLRAIEIDPNEVIIDEVKESLLARGDIQLTVADYNAIEKELRGKLEEKFNTAANGQEADALALEMVKQVYEPVVKAIDRRYRVDVVFQ